MSGGGGGDFMAIPTGEYPFIVEKSTYKPNKKNNGMVLGLRQQCLDPAIGKRVLFDNFNLENPSEDAVQIAKASLKQLALAIGHPTPDSVTNSEDLHGKPYIARVVKRRAKESRLEWADSEGYENAITAYKSIHSGTAAQPAASSSEKPPLPSVAPGDVPF